MPAYAVAIVDETRFGPEIRQYLESIDGTLAPYSGRFIIHGGPYVPVEGDWNSDLIVIEFPDMEKAKAWYACDAYQAIASLRQNNTRGRLLLVQGVPWDHRAIDLLGA